MSLTRLSTVPGVGRLVLLRLRNLQDLQSSMEHQSTVSRDSIMLRILLSDYALIF